MRALIGSSNSEYPVLFTSEQFERKWRPGFASVTSEEIIQINFFGVYYLTVLVYTKTTILLSVGG